MKVYSVDDCISQFLPTADEPFRRQLDKNKGKEFLRNFFAANKREFQPISLLGMCGLRVPRGNFRSISGEEKGGNEERRREVGRELRGETKDRDFLLWPEDQAEIFFCFPH
jgi:hypothetical protein